MLDPEVFSGGQEANSFLQGLEFRVVEIAVADRQERVQDGQGTDARQG